MAVPKQCHTKSRRNKRRMHLFLKEPALTLCPKCGKEKLPHLICWNCGYYKGEEVFNVLKKLDKKERKKREKELKFFFYIFFFFFYKHISEIDKIIGKAAPEWPIEQITIVDRNVLR